MILVGAVTKLCKHRNPEFAYGLHDDEYIEWCPTCGAFRRTKNITASSSRRAKWTKPKMRAKP